MRITIRTEPRKSKKIEVKKGTTIAQLLEQLGINRETVIVRRNNEICVEEEELREGDVIDTIRAISGGAISCDRCGEIAVYFRRSSGQRFCKMHFIQHFEDKVKKTMIKRRMLARGESVGVALSGGKDSITTLYLLNRLARKLDLKVCAILIDEGISSYRSETIKAAKRFCTEYRIPLHTISFKQRLKFTLDALMKKAGAGVPASERVQACSFCGVFRRRLLNEKARELKLNKLATGHNLDDEAQAILMNYLRGDMERLARLERGYGEQVDVGVEPLRPSLRHEKFVPRIKPLMEMPEKEVALYSILRGLSPSFEECPYAYASFRLGVRDLLNRLENENPGIKFSILRGYQKLLPYLKVYAEKEAIGECKLCGEPSSQEICSACRLIEGAKRKRQNV